MAIIDTTKARIVIVSTDGQDREDGNVVYCKVYLVTATGSLTFSETIFADDNTSYYDDEGDVVDTIKSYGYYVHDLPQNVAWTVE